MDVELNNRVVALEKRVRKLKGCIVVMIISIIAIVLKGTVDFSPWSVTTDYLAITDTDGNEVAVLMPYGSLPGFYLSEGPDGEPTASLGEVKPEPSLRLSDKSGHVGVELCYDQFGPRLSLSGPEGKMEAVFSLQEEAPAMWFYRSTGDVRKGEGSSVLFSLDEVGPRLWILDQKGKRGPSLRFIKDTNDVPHLQLLDYQGNAIWSVP